MTSYIYISPQSLPFPILNLWQLIQNIDVMFSPIIAMCSLVFRDKHYILRNKTGVMEITVMNSWVFFGEQNMSNEIYLLLITKVSYYLALKFSLNLCLNGRC